MKTRHCKCEQILNAKFIHHYSEVIYLKWLSCEQYPLQVRKHQMQLFPLFEDYDRVHRGCVSESQFHRVLTELELGSLVNRQEIELISNCFLINQGRRDVYYIGFCDKIYEIAKFEWRKP